MNNPEPQTEEEIWVAMIRARRMLDEGAEEHYIQMLKDLEGDEQ